MRQCAYHALEDLRDVIGKLRDDGTGNGDRPPPPLADLPALVEQSREAGMRVTLDSRITNLPGIPDSISRRGAGAHPRCRKRPGPPA